MYNLTAVQARELIRKSFGTPNLYEINPVEQEATLNAFSVPSNNKIVLRDNTVSNIAGKPVITPVFFPSGNYQEKSSTGIINVPYNSLTLPPSTFVEFIHTKHIVKTKIAGRGGTIKEFISDGDTKVNIRGVFVNDDAQEIPENDLRAFQELVSIPKELPVEGELFEWLGIYNLVIESWSLPPLEGFPNVQPFTLSCISDQPVELKIRDGI